MKALVIVIGFLIMAAGLASAQSGRVGWDGTWAGGWDKNAGVQLIFAGDQLIGFNWRGDYKDIRQTTNTPDGGKRFSWNKGEATLTRTPDGQAQLVVHEGANTISVALKRD